MNISSELLQKINESKELLKSIKKMMKLEIHISR